MIVVADTSPFIVLAKIDLIEILPRLFGKNTEEEFADVFAWLCTLANINNVNLEQAIHDKYLESGGPQGHK